MKMMALGEIDEKISYARFMADVHLKRKDFDQALRYSTFGDQLERQNEQVKAFERYIRGQAYGAAETKVLSTLQDPAGGYVVPGPMLAEFVPLPMVYSPIRKYATVRTLTDGDFYKLPKERTRPGVVWRKETDLHTPTADMSFAGEGIPVHIINSVVVGAQKLVEDTAQDVNEWLLTPVLNAFLVEEGARFVTGTGVGQPEGLLTTPSVTSVKSGNATALTSDGIISSFYALPAVYRANAVWLMNSNTAATVKKFKDANNNPIYKDGWFGLVPDTIMGRPVVDCPDMPDVAAGAYPIVFADLSFYYVIDRTELAVLRDPYSQKPNIVFDCVRRVGGQLINPAAAVKQLVSA